MRLVLSSGISESEGVKGHRPTITDNVSPSPYSDEWKSGPWTGANATELAFQHFVYFVPFTAHLALVNLMIQVSTAKSNGFFAPI